jgi:hypothetical protein
MRQLLFGLAALPFLAGVAAAAQPLSDAQMDRVAAGATCPGAACIPSTSAANGVTTTTSTTGFQLPTSVNPGNFTAVLQSFYAYLSATGYPAQP